MNSYKRYKRHYNKNSFKKDSTNNILYNYMTFEQEMERLHHKINSISKNIRNLPKLEQLMNFIKEIENIDNNWSYQF